jgi:outer membrane beta-barrel protein
MRLPLICALLLASGAVRAQDAGDTIDAVQRRPTRQAKRLELQPYGVMSIADPYLQRWGAGLRAMYHLREGISVGLDGFGFGTWATQELVVAKTELHARVIDSRARFGAVALASIAPIYGKVALPGDTLVHLETFFDAGLGGALTETDTTRGLRPMIAGGIGQRIFLNQNLALMARVGGNLYAERVSINGTPETKAMGFWTVSVGISFYFPRAVDR